MSERLDMSEAHFPSEDPSSFWLLDPKLIFLNHGSFGSCPRPVLEFQSRMRERLERQPIPFFVSQLESEMDAARAALAAFVGAQPADLVAVPNATSGINTVLRSLDFQPGDELVVTNHEYNACRNALNFVTGRTGATVRVASIPFPIASPDLAIDAILNVVTEKTRLVMLDHVTSQTGLVLPLEKIVAT
ncbi:MAG: aminotransferase class V-fold PLP-dependent enzyme, partial [Verrucomicrobiota bacterium]